MTIDMSHANNPCCCCDHAKPRHAMHHSDQSPIPATAAAAAALLRALSINPEVPNNLCVTNVPCSNHLVITVIKSIDAMQVPDRMPRDHNSEKEGQQT